MTKQRIQILVISFCLLGTIYFTILSYQVSREAEPPVMHTESLNQVIGRLAGNKAVDCGRVPVQGNRDVVDGCSVAMFKAGKPFYARYDFKGIDSRIAKILLRTPQGKMYLLHYDSDPSGGSGVGEAVGEDRCLNPQIVNFAGQQRVECK